MLQWASELSSLPYVAAVTVYTECSPMWSDICFRSGCPCTPVVINPLSGILFPNRSFCVYTCRYQFSLRPSFPFGVLRMRNWLLIVESRGLRYRYNFRCRSSPHVYHDPQMMAQRSSADRSRAACFQGIKLLPLLVICVPHYGRKGRKCKPFPLSKTIMNFPCFLQYQPTIEKFSTLDAFRVSFMAIRLALCSINRRLKSSPLWMHFGLALWQSKTAREIACSDPWLSACLAW